MKKVGIITWHYYANFGSALQSYALQTVLEQLGCDARVINYRNPRLTNAQLKELLCCCVGTMAQMIPHPRAQRFSYPFQVFHRNYLKQTRCITDPAELPALADDFDCIACGSDQIWAPNALNTVYMADFADGSTTRKISYAASIGLNTIDETLQETYRKLLADFHAISVREETGRLLLQEVCGLESTVVLDPTLLLDASHYRKMMRKVPGVRAPFLFCYFLNRDHSYRQRVEAYAKARGLTVCGFSARKEDREWMRTMEHLGPREFLWLIEHSQAVFTDSYHGTIFSLLLHKEFFTLERFSNQDPICQNSRIYQLDAWFGIGGRILSSDALPEGCSPLDYEEIDLRLLRAREASRNYLMEALL